MTLLSDGAFKLYVFLCLRADRSSARLEVDQSSVAKSLAKSRRSVIAYFEELCQQGICEVTFATNQHTCGVVKICDAFWPYVIQMPAVETEGAANYVKHLRMLLKRAVVLSMNLRQQTKSLPILSFLTMFRLNMSNVRFSLDAQGSMSPGSTGKSAVPLSVSDIFDQSLTRSLRWKRQQTTGDTSARALISMSVHGSRRVPMVERAFHR